MTTQVEREIKEFILSRLWKYYESVDARKPHYQEADVRKLPIWQLWVQGPQEAPPLARQCFRSVDRHSEHRLVGIPSVDNFRELADLPGFVYDKHKRGTMSHGHFAEIAAMFLLEKYGGTWIDATCLLTDSIPAGILDAPFFAFRCHTTTVYDAHRLIAPWFISAKPGHVIVRNMKNALLRFWEKEDAVSAAPIFEFLAHGMILNHAELTRVWLEGPQQPLSKTLLLDEYRDQPFQSGLWRQITDLSFIHKLPLNKGVEFEGSLLHRCLYMES